MPQQDATPIARPQGGKNAKTRRTSRDIDIEFHRGQTVGPYVIIRTLAKGGMGIVYEAEHIALGRRSALKAIRFPEHANFSIRRELEARFEREARILAALDHPNLVTIFDQFTHQNRRFMCMELLAGKNLHQLIKETQPLRSETALQIALQISLGLEHAHKKSIVHRDLKPSNVLVLESHGTNTTNIKVLDFGVASFKALSASESNITTAGQFIGSPSYCSPEQALGKPATVRSDLYSLGCVLHFMLTGQKPFERDSEFETLNAHANGPLPSLTSEALTESERELLQPFLDRLLAKQPQDRYASATEVIEEIQRLTNHEQRNTGDGITRAPSLNAMRTIALVLFTGVATWASTRWVDGSPESPRPSSKQPKHTRNQSPVSPTCTRLRIQNRSELEGFMLGTQQHREHFVELDCYDGPIAFDFSIPVNISLEVGDRELGIEVRPATEANVEDSRERDTSPRSRRRRRSTNQPNLIDPWP